MSPPCSMDGYAAARRPPVVGAAGMRAAVLRNAVRRGAASRPPGRRYSGGHRVPRLVGRGEGRVALAQVVVADLAGAAHVVVGEVDRVQVHLVGHVLVPVQAARGGGLEVDEAGRRCASNTAKAARASPGCCSSPWCSAIASCMAMRVPEPNEKCTVRSASPSSTMFWCDQHSLRTMFASNHSERLPSSSLAPRSSRNTSAQ